MIQCDNCYSIWPDDCDATHCDCGESIDEHCHEIACAECHQSLRLDDGCEWPSRRLYCWSCAHSKLDEAESLLRRIDDACEKPKWSDRNKQGLTMKKKKTVDIPFAETQYGFRYGAVEVTRMCSDHAKGWVTLEVKTPKQSIQVYVTKTGKIRIHDASGEWFKLTKG